MRRSFTWWAVPVAAVALTACGSDTPTRTTETSTASSRTTTTSSTTTTAEPSSSSSTSATATTSTTTSPTSSSTTSPPSTSSSTGGAATTISTVWVDDSWTVEQLTDDLCAQGGLTEATFSKQDEIFTCGPTAASAKACTFADGGKTTCITDPLGRKAIRFTSPTVDNWDGQMHPRGQEVIPMYVVLDDDTTCAVASHDHGQHWQGRFSWYPCSDGSELLTDEKIEDTFDSDAAAWTVDRSVDQGKPTSTRVKTAVYAGTR